MFGLRNSGVLFGQAAVAIGGETGAAPSWQLPTWAVIAALAIVASALVALVSTVLGLRHARLLRDRDHAERMRALELGHPLPGSGDESGGNAPPGVLIGLFVPLGVFGIAFVASQSGHAPSQAWTAAAIVGTAGVICGTILTLNGACRTTPALAPGKPRVDPEAYEELAQRH